MLWGDVEEHVGTINYCVFALVDCKHVVKGNTTLIVEETPSKGKKRWTRVRMANMTFVKLSKFGTIMHHDCNAKSHVIVSLLPLSIGMLHAANRKWRVGLGCKEWSPKDPMKLQGRRS